MGFKDVRYAVCDRCGERVELKGGPFGSRSVESAPAGWVDAGQGRPLCPKCSPVWETLLARQRVEREDYLAARDA